MDLIFCVNDGIDKCDNDLLQENPGDQSDEKCSGSQYHSFFQKEVGDLLFMESEQQIGCKFSASFFSHEPHHIMDQPDDNDYDKKCNKTDQHCKHSRFCTDLLDILGKDHGVECKHQGGNEYHRHEINKIVSERAFCVS